MNTTRRLRVAAGLCAAALSCAAPAADETLWRETTLELIETLVEQGVLTRKKADALLERARARAAARTPPPVEPGDVRVTHVPETVKDEIREQVRQDVMARAKAEQWGTPGALPAWTENLTFSGELLLRTQADFFDRGNSTGILNVPAINAAGTLSTPNATLYTDPLDPSRPQDDRLRYRVRLRLGVEARISDTLSAGMRFTTGTTTEPTLIVQTLGTGNNRYGLVVDRAYFRYRQADWLELAGGRIPNPLLNTELMFQQEMGFEGFAGTVRHQLPGGARPWLTLGAFPLQELGASSRNKWLYAGQVGVDWQPWPAARSRVGLAWYQYTNTTGTRNPATGNTRVFDFTAPQFVQKGNTMFNIADTTTDPNAALFALAADYRLLDLTATTEIAARGDNRIVLTGNLVKNFGFDRAAVAARTGLDVAPRTTAWLARAAYGQPELAARGQWVTQLGYRYIERDAVLDAFNDPFFHLGGTDAKGYDLMLGLGVEKGTSLQLRWLSASSIDGPRLNIDTLMLDLYSRF